MLWIAWAAALAAARKRIEVNRRPDVRVRNGGIDKVPVGPPTRRVEAPAVVAASQLHPLTRHRNTVFQVG
jgi:hypothetical protein